MCTKEQEEIVLREYERRKARLGKWVRDKWFEMFIQN